MKDSPYFPHGLVDRNTNNGYPYISRDWQEIVCKAISCQWNRSGFCTTPSRAIINDDGRCNGFNLRNNDDKK